MTADPRPKGMPLGAQIAIAVLAIILLGFSAFLLSERHRLQGELAQEKTDLEAFKADLKVFCEVIRLQESYSSQPTAAAASAQTGTAVFVSPVFSHQVSNRFGDSKLEELCPRTTETVEEPFKQPG
ncbi:hypothetical protein PGN35_014310 [Nodosilinea sp. PGN35]|uniref:hypothetical protein n=1 Tax=Nodosilinea sp. PGN35 TaxID=3020489 RepID=UPI0023B27DB6|nr:hypothetical protein [Nodosilinea sp. TSF1-S3]MDF0364865.1 hypothetical protein [Nodosilinea sp. TSF1-S3]